MLNRKLVFPIGWAVAILVICSIPGEELPDMPFSLFDKFVHLAVFAVLSFAWSRALGQKKWPGILLMSCIYGVALEFYQEIIPIGRFTDTGDMIANCLGVVVGLLLAVLIPPIWTKNR